MYVVIIMKIVILGTLVVDLKFESLHHAPIITINMILALI